MTFPMPFVPPFQSAGGLTAPSIVGSDGRFGTGGYAEYPAGIQAGDLIIGHCSSSAVTNFRAASGFTLLYKNTDYRVALMAYKIATGSESGAIGGLTDASFIQIVSEVIEVLRFNNPISSVTDLSLGVGWRSNGTGPNQTISTGSTGTPPVLALAAFGSAGNMSNSDITHSSGSLWDTTYGPSGPELKTRGWFWGSGETPTDRTIGFVNDPGSENSLIGVAIEVS